MAFKMNKPKEKATINLGAHKLTAANHEKLVKYIVERLDASNTLRTAFVERISLIDKELSGFIKLDQDDRKRQRDNRNGKGPKTTDFSLQITHAQLDEAATYMLSVLVPDEGMYGAIATKDKQDIANGFAATLNQHGLDFQHYRNYGRLIFNQLKYNFGVGLVEWARVYGNRIKNGDAGGNPVVVNELVIQGNRLEAIDMYNFIWDASVKDLIKLPTDGEFIAVVDMHTKFRLMKMAANKEIYGIERFIDTPDVATYYRNKPIIHDLSQAGSGGTDWVSTFTLGGGKETTSGYELLTAHIWINPKDFGLASADEWQIWRICLANAKYIVAVEQMTNAHGKLPVGVGMPIEDGLGLQTKSFAEMLLPLQRFISHQFNIKQRADRKGLYGLTIYDQNVIPLLEAADLEGGTVPAKPVGQDKDLRRSIYTHNDKPDTANTLRDIQATNDLMQKMLPTDITSQVASLERATQYQAAATVQGGHKREHKIAKTIYDQCFTPIRTIMMYNTFQFQESITVIDNKTGDLIEVDPAQFRDTQIEFSISDGLKGIDRLHVSESLKEVINMMLQSQVAATQVDIVDIIDYYLNIVGDKTDFKQFKYKSQIDALPPEQKDIAFQLLQQYLAEQEQAGGVPNA